MPEYATKVYVVEIPGQVPECGNFRYHPFDSARGCCPYAPESPVHGDVQWVAVDNTEDPEEAVRLAKGYPRARVRQFQVYRTITERDTLTPKTNVLVPDAPLVDMVCQDHPEVKMRWMPDGRVNCPIVCNICHKPLVTQETLAAMNNPIDLSEI